MSPVALQIQDLEHQPSGGRILFKKLSLEVQESEFVAVVGPSGCGKSTLLRLICGLESPTRGVLKKNFSNPGFVFQEPRLLPWRTVQENLALPFEIQTRPPPDFRSTISRVRLHPDVLRLFPHQLSGGMKMRVSLLRALLIEPDLLLLDEPLAALDENTRQLLQEEISALHHQRPVTTFFVTHSLSEALFLAGRVVVLGPDGERLHDLRVNWPKPRTSELRSDPRYLEELKTWTQEFRTELVV